MESRNSLNYSVQEGESITPRNGDFGFGTSDRRYAYSRQPSFHQSQEPQTPISRISNEFTKPFLSRTVSSIDMPPGVYSFDENEKAFGERKVSVEKLSVLSIFQAIRTGNKSMKKLFALISLNVAYSTVELAIGLFTGRIGLVSDAFHLTFGCGILTFSLFTMAASRKKSDHAYTYGYKRLEVLSAFTNALFLLFLSFSLAVEALHAFIQDESEHKHYLISVGLLYYKHYLIFSAVTNLLVNVIGVWFFRNYARINLGILDPTAPCLNKNNISFFFGDFVIAMLMSITSAVYRKSEDMNYHSVCLHVLADSIRSAGLILASWFLSLGVENAEVLCLGLVSVAIFMLVMPLFKTTGGILLQMSPPSIPPSALSKCLRQITAREDVTDVTQARFWELVPGHVVGSLSILVKGTDDRPVLQFVHSLYHDLGIKELTVQADSD